jgi:hypothetical protein
LRAWCRRHEVYCAIVDPRAGLEHALLRELPAAGILRGKA